MLDVERVPSGIVKRKRRDKISELDAALFVASFR